MKYRLIPTLLAITVGLAACEPNIPTTNGQLPDKITTKSGTTINVKNALAVDMNKAQLTIETTTRESAVASLAKFCKNGKLNLSTIQKKLRSAGYLDVGESSSGDVTIWANPNGSTVMGTGGRGGGQVICFAMMARAQADAKKMEPLIRSKLNPNVISVPPQGKGVQGAWVADSKTRGVYILVKDKKFSGIAYGTS